MDDAPDTSKEDDLPSVDEIYGKWMQSLQDCYREVTTLRAHLTYLQQFEREIQISVNVPAPTVNYGQPIYGATSNNSIALTIPISTMSYPAAPMMPYVQTYPTLDAYGAQKIADMLASAPHHSKHWLDTIGEEYSALHKKLDIAAQTVRRFGILKLAQDKK